MEKMEKNIQEKIYALDNSKSFYEQDYYFEIIRDLYNIPEIYVGLSYSDYHPEDGTSTPGIFTKDGFPAIYVFTELEYAKFWSNHYRLPIAKIERTEGMEIPYGSLYQLARTRGAERVFVNEGQKFLCFPIKELFEVTGAEARAELLPTEEENRTNWVPKSEEDFRFNRVKALKF